MKRNKKKLQHFSSAWKMSSHIEVLSDNVRVSEWEREPSGMWKLEIVVRLSFHISYFIAILHPVQNVCKCNMAGRRNILEWRTLWDNGKERTREKKSSECCGIFYGPLINSQRRVQGECYNKLLCQPSARRLTVGKSLCDSSSPHSLFKADLHAPHSNAGQPQNGRNTAS